MEHTVVSTSTAGANAAGVLGKRGLVCSPTNGEDEDDGDEPDDHELLWLSRRAGRSCAGATCA
jgi:hypothetical protein